MVAAGFTHWKISEFRMNKSTGYRFQIIGHIIKSVIKPYTMLQVILPTKLKHDINSL